MILILLFLSNSTIFIRGWGRILNLIKKKIIAITTLSQLGLKITKENNLKI